MLVVLIQQQILLLLPIKLKKLIWYEDVSSDEGEGVIEISKEDKKGYGEDAYITEDGKLYFESSGSVLGEPYDHLIFERQ